MIGCLKLLHVRMCYSTSCLQSSSFRIWICISVSKKINFLATSENSFYRFYTGLRSRENFSFRRQVTKNRASGFANLRLPILEGNHLTGSHGFDGRDQLCSSLCYSQNVMQAALDILNLHIKSVFKSLSPCLRMF